MNRRPMGWVLSVLVFSLACFSGVALAQQGKDALRGHGILKVGAIFAATGPAAWLGEPEKNTAELIADKVNDSGGVNRCFLELIVMDDQTSPEKAVSAAQRLITEDKVLAIIGPSTSGASMALKPICEAAQVPMVSCAAAEAIVTPISKSKFIFKTPHLDSHVAVRILDHMKEMGISKIAVMHESLAFGKAGLQQLETHAKGAGIDIVARESYGKDETDFTPHLKRIQESGAEAIVNWAIVPNQSIIPKDMKKLGLRLPLFQSHGFGNLKYIEAAGDAAEGIVFPAGRLLVAKLLPPQHYQKHVLWNYQYDYEHKFGPVSTFGGHSYDALRLVVRAMRSKQITPETDLQRARTLIRDGLEETKNWVGTAGKFNMSSTDHTGLDKDESLEMLYVDKGGTVKPLSSKPK